MLSLKCEFFQMIMCDFQDPYAHRAAALRDAAIANTDARLLTVAANAAERKAATFADAGDERMAVLQIELSRTRRRITERLFGAAAAAGATALSTDVNSAQQVIFPTTPDKAKE